MFQWNINLFDQLLEIKLLRFEDNIVLLDADKKELKEMFTYTDDILHTNI